MQDQSDGISGQKPTRGRSQANEAPVDTSVNTIVDVSAQISHEIVDHAKLQANELAHLPIMLLHFLRNPILFIRSTPDLKTPSWVAITIVSGVLGSLLNAITHQSWLRFFIALFILPTGSFLSVFATNSLMKLIFRGAYGLRFRYRSGASIFAFANIFWWVLAGVSDSAPFLSLLGLLAAVAIAAIGFTTKLQLPVKAVSLWFSLLALAQAGLWSLGRWLGN